MRLEAAAAEDTCETEGSDASGASKPEGGRRTGLVADADEALEVSLSPDRCGCVVAGCVEGTDARSLSLHAGCVDAGCSDTAAAEVSDQNRAVWASGRSMAATTSS